MKRIPSISCRMPAVGWLVCIALLLAGCSKQNEFEYVDDIIKDIDDNTPAIVVTDENGNESVLPGGTMIGIYVMDGNGNVSLQQAEVDENGKAVLPTSDQQGGIIAYSPYQESWSKAAIDNPTVFTVASDQRLEENYNASDFMIGSMGQVTRAPEGAMVLEHKLAKVAIHVIDETGTVNLGSISAELLNVKNNVLVDLPKKQVTTIPSSSANIFMLSKMTTDWRISNYAIVAPQQISEGMPFFAITLYGNRQSYPAPQAAELESGKTYTINLRLTEHGLIPNGWYITDWNEENERIIDVRG